MAKVKRERRRPKKLHVDAGDSSERVSGRAFEDRLTPKTRNSEEKNDTSLYSNESKSSSLDAEGHRPYLSAYKRAQLVYERLRAERREKAEQARLEKEKHNEEVQMDREWRKKKNRVLQLRTRKGQPNLNAQIGVLLEKLERDDQKKKDE